MLSCCALLLAKVPLLIMIVVVGFLAWLMLAEKERGHRRLRSHSLLSSLLRCFVVYINVWFLLDPRGGGDIHVTCVFRKLWLK